MEETNFKTDLANVGSSGFQLQIQYIMLLTRLLPVYEYVATRNPIWVDIFMPICNSITRQSIVLESCSNP